jgi:alpha-galactosidase
MLLRKRQAALFLAGIAMLASSGLARGAAEASILGSWNAKGSAPASATVAPPPEATLTFSRNGDAVSGVMRAGGNEYALFDVREADGNVSFTVVIPGTPYLSLRYAGTLKGNTLNLASADEGQGQFALTAEREGPAPAPSAATAAIEQKPAVQPAAPRAATARPPTPPPEQRQASAPPPPATPPAAPAAPAAAGQAIQGSYITRLLNQLPAPSPAPAAQPPAPPAASPPPPVMRGAPVPPTAPIMQGAPVPPTPAPVMSGVPVPGQPPAQVATLEPPKPPAPPPAPKPSFELAGEWKGQQASPGSGAPVDVTLAFTDARGTMRVGKEEWPLFDVKGTGDELSFTLVIPGTPYVTIHYRGTVVSNDLMLASLDEGQGIFTLNGHRDGAPASVETKSALRVAETATPVARSPTPPVAEPPAPVAPKPAASVSETPAPAAAKPAPSIAAASAPDVPAPAPVVASAPAPVPTAPQPRPAPASENTTAVPAPVAAAPAQQVASATPAPARTQQASTTAPVQTPAPPPDLAASASATSPANAPEATLLQRTPPRAVPPAISATPPAVASLAPLPVPAIQPQPAAPAAPNVPKSFARPPLSALPEKLPLPALADVTPNANVFKTPPMGWASRGKLGTLIDADIVRQAADTLNENGLKAVGYTLIEVDDGWQGERDITGTIKGNDNFPDMKGLVDYVHGRGLRFGLFASAAPLSCGGFEGSYGHEAEDAKTFAAWGVDYVIYDWCGAEKIYSTQAEQQAAYQKMGAALKASGRDIAFGVSQNGMFNVATWAPKTGANLWRTAEELSDSWKSVSEVGFARDGKGAGPNGWSDPGLIQFGNGGMTADEYRTQLNLWTVFAAPMMIGSDTRRMARDVIAGLANQEVIAVDQDPVGAPGKRVTQAGQTEVWARTLADGSVAVGFFNHGDSSAPVAVSWDQLGLMGPRQVRDLWWHQNIGMANNNYVVFLAPHASMLLKFGR